MNIDERLDRILQEVQFLMDVQRSHDEQIAKLVEEGARVDRRLNELTDQTKNALDAITRLSHIAAAHEERLDGHDGRLEDLET